MSEISPLVRLVDDDDAFRESQKLFLSMCGYEVKDWADPVRFLEEDDPRVPGCLVLDIRMPEMTGLELQRALYVRGNKLPIIFLTGHGDIETAVYTMKYGAVDFFEKRGDPLIETLFPRLAKDLVNTGGRKKKRKSLKKPSIL